MMSRETIPILKETLVQLTLGWSAFQIWVFVTEITDEFILGLDVLRACDASVHLGPHVPRLGLEVFLWGPGARPRTFRLTLASNEVILALCEKVVTAWREGPLEAANSSVEPILNTSYQEGLCIARPLGSRSTEGTDQNYDWELPGSGAGWRHHPGPLWTSYVAGADLRFRTPNSEDTRTLWVTARCGIRSQAGPERRRILAVGGINHRVPDLFRN
jgi:hypothetical protein